MSNDTIFQELLNVYRKTQYLQARFCQTLEMLMEKGQYIENLGIACQNILAKYQWVRNNDKYNNLPNDCILVNRCWVTPSGLQYVTPTIEQSNRVLRFMEQQNNVATNYFMRVTVCEDNGDMLNIDSEDILLSQFISNVMCVFLCFYFLLIFCICVLSLLQKQKGGDGSNL